MRALKEKVASKHLVGLVNNAGTYSGEGYGNRDYVGELISGRVYEDYVADEAVNVRAMINVTGTLVPDLLEGAKACGSATILNVGSINGVLSFEDSLPYGATKGAVEMWTDALRRTLAGRGIRVTALQPGLMRTNMCPDAYCEPPEKTCVPAVVRALTLSEPRSRYTFVLDPEAPPDLAR
ncbi:hypothetical protein CTAYLR_003177 [Chrysophaeum taylorii]|uniref:SDR family NAD(P)-dependent oxidoreductase n=1 Tax=Chrysophaeum taylorii TaxID=2483200 RepID=A0AAD7UDH7_9STRA|nr:hypothetical protein CTAYLR_003177 [Chrysophaeum taylorii]